MAISRGVQKPVSMEGNGGAIYGKKLAIHMFGVSLCLCFGDPITRQCVGMHVDMPNSLPKSSGAVDRMYERAVPLGTVDEAGLGRDFAMNQGGSAYRGRDNEHWSHVRLQTIPDGLRLFWHARGRNKLLGFCAYVWGEMYRLSPCVESWYSASAIRLLHGSMSTALSVVCVLAEALGVITAVAITSLKVGWAAGMWLTSIALTATYSLCFTYAGLLWAAERIGIKKPDFNGYLE